MGKISLWAAGLLYAFPIDEPHPHLGIFGSCSRDASVTITSRRHAGFAHRKRFPGLNRIDAPKARPQHTHPPDTKSECEPITGNFSWNLAIASKSKHSCQVSVLRGMPHARGVDDHACRTLWRETKDICRTACTRTSRQRPSTHGRNFVSSNG